MHGAKSGGCQAPASRVLSWWSPTGCTELLNNECDSTAHQRPAPGLSLGAGHTASFAWHRPPKECVQCKLHYLHDGLGAVSHSYQGMVGTLPKSEFLDASQGSLPCTLASEEIALQGMPHVCFSHRGWNRDLNTSTLALGPCLWAVGYTGELNP